MASIGTLAIDIAANLKPLTGSLDKAQAMLTGFAAAAAAAGAVAIKQFIDTGSALKDMSDRTGVSAEALSTLKFAAEQSDTSLEALQGGLIKMARFMESASQGSDAAATTLGQLGLEISDLQAMSPDQKFKAFASAISAIEDPGKRAALTMQVFGKGAADLIPLLAQGGNGIAVLQQEARDLGLVMTDSAAASAEEFGDTLAKLTSAIKMVVVHVGGMFVPALSGLVETLAYAVSHNKNLAQTLAVLIGVLAGLVIIWKAVTIAQQAYAKAATIAMALSGPKGWIILGASLTAAAAATYGLTKTFREMNAEMEKATPAQAQMVAGIEGMTEAIEGGALAAVDKLKRAMDPWKESGYAAAVYAVWSEIRILKGWATEASIELERMAKFGIPPEALEHLDRLWKIRDKLKKQQEDAEIAARAEADEAERLRREAEKLAQIENNNQAGGFTPINLSGSKDTSTTEKRQSGAIKRGSAEAYQLIAASQERESEIVQATKEQTQQLLKGMAMIGMGGVGAGVAGIVPAFTP